MIDFEQINLSNARSAFALANVPMYIARALRTDETVIELSMKYSSKDLADEFQERIAEKPESLRSEIIPFVLAVALFLKQDLESLRKLSQMDLSNRRWLSEVVHGLIALNTGTISVTDMSDDKVNLPAQSIELSRPQRNTSATFSELAFN